VAVCRATGLCGIVLGWVLPTAGRLLVKPMALVGVAHPTLFVTGVAVDYSFLHHLLLFGQNGPKGGPGGGGGDLTSMLVLVVPIIFLFYFFLIRPQRREQQQRQRMLDAVKKNDRVITVGGIYGVVTNVHHEANEITIKVDESTNTKLRLTLGSIARVVGEEAPEEKK
jgi:preprotein translocase subunit YajC